MSAPSRDLFTRIAGCYDALNRVMSCGVDLLWRRRALDMLAEGLGDSPRATLLDLATGTGDLAVAAAKRFPGLTVTGLDATPAMLVVGRTKVSRAGFADRITLVEGDAEALDLPAGSFDAATCAFGFRNFPHKEQALAEAARVLRPGGTLVVLELFRIESRLFAWFTSIWLGLLARFFARRLRGDYTYLRRSIERTVSAKEFVQLAAAAGFTLKKESFYPPSCHCLFLQKCDRI